MFGEHGKAFPVYVQRLTAQSRNMQQKNLNIFKNIQRDLRPKYNVDVPWSKLSDGLSSPRESKSRYSRMPPGTCESVKL